MLRLFLSNGKLHVYFICKRVCGASVKMEEMRGFNLLSEENTIIITTPVFFPENSCEHLFSSFKTLVHQQTNEKQSCVHIGSHLVWLAGFHRKTFSRSSIIRLVFIRDVQVFFLTMKLQIKLCVCGA